MKNKISLFRATLLLALLFVYPAVARPRLSSEQEDTPWQPNASGFSAWGILGYGNGLGAGARVMLPLTSESFLNSSHIQDRLAIEFGADLLYFSYAFTYNDYGFMEVLPVVGLLWTVWLNESFAVYPKIDIGYGLGFLTGWNDYWGTRPTYGGLFWQTSAGFLYKTRAVNLRLEVGNGLIKAGVGIGF